MIDFTSGFGLRRAAIVAGLALLVVMAVAGGVRSADGAATNGVHLFTGTSATYNCRRLSNSVKKVPSRP